VRVVVGMIVVVAVTHDAVLLVIKRRDTASISRSPANVGWRFGGRAANLQIRLMMSAVDRTSPNVR
jgi:hypothetical protein